MRLGFCLALILCTTTPSPAISSLTREDRQPIEHTSGKPYTAGIKIGEVTSSELDEISGITASHSNRDCFWVHNDSGDVAQIYLIDQSGSLRATISLPVVARDWEDIAYGDGYIYIGDTGDNEARHSDKRVYRLKEPQINLTDKAQNISISESEIEMMRFNFADAIRDCETMMWDAVTKELAFISKREEQVLLYTTPFIATSGDDIIEIVPSATLPLSMATAGEISPSGDKILIKTYFALYLWERKCSDTLAQTLKNLPTQLEYEPEPQGEAITWHRALDQFYTVSEKVGSDNPILYEYNATI